MVSSLVAASLSAASLKLIPTPQRAERGPGSFTLTHDVAIVLGESKREEDQFAARQLNLEVQRCLGFRLPLRSESHRAVLLGQFGDAAVCEACTRCGLGVSSVDLARLGNEGYVLYVGRDEIVVAGNTSAGTFYGVQTLKQLIRGNRTGCAIPEVRIKDWPALRYRGYSDDISRGPIPTMEFLKREIRTMAEFKMNLLTFYTEHVFYLKKHPEIAPPDALTAEQARELSDYAKLYHVELVGNFQSFGHFWNILKHPKYAGIRETMGVVCPVKEETYQLIGDIYSEIAPAYESKLFNVNCDETYGLGEGPSKDLVQKIGVGGVYVRHMIRLHDMLKGYGKRMMMWGDIALQHADIVQQLPKDTILLSWGYGAAPNYDGAIEPFVRAGFEFMVCPGVSCWSQIFPNYENALVNIHNYVRDGARFGALGVLNTTWDDDGENLFSWNFYGTNWGAQCAWNPKNSDVGDYNSAFSQLAYGTRSAKAATAIRLLSSCANIGLTRGLSDSAFWDLSTSALATTVRATREQATRLRDVTEQAMQLLREGRHEAIIDGVDFDYLLFAARRLHFIAVARLARVSAAEAYERALLASDSSTAARSALSRFMEETSDLTNELRGIRSEYIRLWNLENRPDYLKYNLGRYDNLVNVLLSSRRTLLNALTELDRKGILPDPRPLGLEIVETSQRSAKSMPAREPLLPKGAPWTEEECTRRLPLRIDTGDVDRIDCPVQVGLNLKVDGKEPWPGDVSLIECRPEGNKLQAVPCQYESGGTERGVLDFLLRGRTPARTSRWYYVYWKEPGPPPPPQGGGPIHATETKEGVRVENECYRILLGKEGAHLYVWQVKALKSPKDGSFIDITEPGETGWSGFTDTSGADRTAQFDLRCEAAGPVVVRYRCKSKVTGNEKVFNFFSGVPWVEVLLSNALSFYWDYDNVANFAADSSTPGTAFFSNGAREPVCKSSEQTHNVGYDVTWGAKVRADGFVLANLTPEVGATHMVGPGGGWGGVGIEGGAPAAHFITYAAIPSGNPADTLKALQQTLDFRQQVRVVMGKVEKK